MPIVNSIQRGVPFLGICVGLQWMMESSEEAPEVPGLGNMAGRMRALPCFSEVTARGMESVGISRPAVATIAGNSIWILRLFHAFLSRSFTPQHRC